MTYEYCPKCGLKLIPKQCGDDGDIPFCENWKRPFFPSFSTCVICLCLSDESDEIALIRQSYGHGNFVNVAGYIKPWESAEETAVREIKEETGLEAVSLRYIKSYPYEQRDNLMLGYACKVKKTEFRLSSEVAEVKWFSLDEAVKTLREGSIAQQLLKEYMADRHER